MLAGAFFALPAVAVAADGVSIVDTINASGVISVQQPESLARLVIFSAAADTEHDAETGQQAPTTRTGYRVQVFDDNNPRTARNNAESAHARMRAGFPHLRSYLTFNSPYWRVKVGDFRTRAEAQAVLEQIKAANPHLGAYLRVVRDKINLTD